MFKNAQFFKGIGFSRTAETLHYKAGICIACNGIYPTKSPGAVVAWNGISTSLPSPYFLHIKITRHVGIRQSMRKKEAAFYI